MLSKHDWSRWLTIAIGALAVLMSTPVSAASLRKAAAAAGSNAGSGDPGSVLYGYYDVSEPTTGNGTGNGDNAMRLINSTGHDMCALIYVFDDDEQMGECCGCPLTANEVATFGIGGSTGLTNDLLANWREASEDQNNGVIAAVGATALIGCTPNGSASNSTENPACTDGCDPTIPFQDGVLIQGTASGQGLHGNIIRSLHIGTQTSLTEVSMFDDSPGDSTNTVANLQDQCKNAIQNGSGRGWCTCPVSVIAPVIAGNKRMCLMIPTATETPLNSANWVQDLGSTTANVPITEVKVTLQNICTFSISARIPGGKTGDFSIDAGGGVIQVFAPENDPNQKDVHTLTVSFAGAAARTAPYMSKIPIIWSVEGLLDMKSEQATVNLTLKAKVN